MKKAALLWLLLILLFSMSAHATNLQSGSYLMNDGNMTVTFMINQLPDGKYFVNAEGKNTAGNICRIGDLGTLSGNTFTIGVCKLNITPTADGFKLEDVNKCIVCDKGAYISGNYKRQ